MRKKNKKKRLLVVVLLLVMLIGVGYALISTTLNINGTTGIKKSTWNIHFANVQEFEGSVVATEKAKINDSDPTKVSYEITLSNPGDFYQFNVDVVNEGSIDGMVNLVESKMDGEVLSKLPGYLEYSVTYNDGQEIKAKQALKSEETKTYTVRIAYKKDLNEEDLPKSEKALSMEFSVEYVQADGEKVDVDTKLCKRANVETLHTEICEDHGGQWYPCDKLYSAGETISYGNKSTTSGELKSGDAFDCDVNGDGVYNSNTERFYYVSDYYDTTSKSFDDGYATLIYYNNVKAGVPDNKATFAYDASNENWHGPVTGYVQLPSVSQWSKVTLLNETRQLLNENAGNTTTGGMLGTFTYTGKAARLLTVQEVNKACGITAGTWIVGELDTCEYLLENTWYADTALKHWWLENARSANSNGGWNVGGAHRNVGNVDTYDDTLRGFRPAIDVLKTNMLY